MAINNFDPEKIKILGWNLVQEQIITPLGFDPANIAYHGFNVEMQLDMDPGDELLKADQRIEVITESEGKNEEETQAVFQIIYFIRVEDLANLTIPRLEDKVVLQSDPGNFIAGLTYSTSRGILLTRVQGTGVKDFILPVIDTDAFLNGNLNKA